MTTAYKPILLVDFDGCVHSYTSGWQGEDNIPDPPVRGALQWLWEAASYWDVRIYSSRSRSERGYRAMQEWLIYWAACIWDDDFVRTFMATIKICAEKPPAFLTIDDRAICFQGDWLALDPAQLLNFKPWYLREEKTHA